MHRAIDEYLTAETIRLALTGLAAGMAAGLVRRILGRTGWGAVPLVLAVFIAARHSGRSDWPDWDAMSLMGLLTFVVSGIGSARLLTASARWEWVAAGALVSAVGVWAGVPETGPALLVGGAVTGYAIVAVLSGSRWGWAAGLGWAGVIGWAALSGAVDRPSAVVGGTLCTGLAPWFALRKSSLKDFDHRSGIWLLGAHTVVVVLAARWIGVDPGAGWARTASVAGAGLAVAVMTRCKASWTKRCGPTSGRW